MDIDCVSGQMGISRGAAMKLWLHDRARLDEALAEVNRSTFGLQAGIFTRDLFKMFDAWDRLEVGGVVINDVPSYRVDNMPYGGVKDSGLGREGIRFAMEDMSEIRNLVIRRESAG